MKGIQFKIVVIAAAMTLAFASAAWSDDRRQDRQRLQSHQVDRIHKGVARGKITNKEYRKLQREHQQLQNARKKAWADGRITRNERKRLANLKRKAEKHIYMATYNHHKRNLHKHGKYSWDRHKTDQYFKYPPRHRYDHHYRRPYYRQNDFLFSGVWLEPSWGLSLHARDQCRR